MHVVGCPLADSDVETIESMRSCAAMFLMVETDVEAVVEDMSGGEVYHLESARWASTYWAATGPCADAWRMTDRSVSEARRPKDSSSVTRPSRCSIAAASQLSVIG